MKTIILWVLAFGVPVHEPVAIEGYTCESFVQELQASGTELKDGYQLVCADVYHL